jgi:hypothetical protein
MVRSPIIHTPIHHFVRHMRKQDPDQRPEHDINRMMPPVAKLAESHYHSDTLRRHKQHELPVMNSLTRFLLLIQLRPPIMLSEMPTPAEHFVLCIEPQREEAKARECGARMAARKAHLCFFDLGRLAGAHVAGGVVLQATPGQGVEAAGERWDRWFADGEEVWTQAADEDLDDRLEEGGCGEGVA